MIIEPRFDTVPQELQDINNWILWKLVKRDGREIKLPWSVYDQAASSTDENTWSSYECVVMRYEPGKHAGIGFVFSKGCGYAGVDFDACRNPVTGEMAEWSAEWVRKFGTYTEISPSGTGVKMWLRSEKEFTTGKNIKIDQPAMPGCDKKPGIEIYTQGRYFAVTGRVLRGFAA